MYKCIIIGGGVHGITMANYLLNLNKLTPDELLIIDPHAESLANWHRCTNTIFMPFLRSPGVHHLDIPPLSLGVFAKNNQYSENASFQSGTVLLATGFQPTLPGKSWLTPVIEENHLECAACGYPIVTKNLQWGPN